MTDQALMPQLPKYVTTFIGREAEQSTLGSALEVSRFVALVGPGGVGKTRLVSHLVERLTKRFPEGVFFADLAGVSEPAEFCARAAAALGMRNSGQVSSVLLSDFVQDLEALVVLDSCDSLDSDCLLLLQDLVASGTQSTILATSRRALYVDGGQLVNLSPLSLPVDTTPEVRLSDVLGSESAKLFLARARLVRPGFTVAESQAPALSRLCHRLDGLPLAIELAAAWTRALSIEQIIERMEGYPDFPRAGAGATDPRHRTLRTLTAGSYELCSDDEKLLWSRLTVFENTFDLPAVEAVCGQPPLTPPDLLDLLASLVDQSVVLADNIGEEVRYSLLRLTRDYGESRLDDFGERQVLHNKHLAYYEGSFNRLTTAFPGSSERERIERLRLEYPNILAAINHGLQAPDLSAGSLRMAAGLWFFWFAVGQLSEGRSTLGRVLASANTDAYPREREYALCIHAYLCALQSKLRSAEKLLELAASQAPTGDALNLALSLQVSGVVEAGHGRVSSARELLDKAIDAYKRVPGPTAEILTMDAIGVAVLLAAFDHDNDRVADLSRTGLDLCDDFDDYMWRGYIEYALAVHDWIQNEPTRARELALKVAGYGHDQLLLAHCIELLAWCAQQAGQNARAATLFGGADRLWKFVGGHFSGFHNIGAQREESLGRCRDVLGQKAFDLAYAKGFQTDTNDLLLQEAAGKDGIVGPEPDAAVRLTRREKEVAALLGRGLSNREIASELTISPRTAETHVENILAKFGLENRAQMAAAWARLHPDSTGS
ncbi:LuxR C-terminal-related transcriptional regulator [Arthrobacter sp. MW3 TE3886]|jgi:predicted ATPase/DNA-binding CsgD family transcriptional regulator|uniref:ATP-binding protein n=1 Tax=Arthrobacter sp. MW3 TE3886 TaxID=3156254 RepID=UPI0035144DB3